MTNEELKMFKRYLKERGLYIEFINEARKFPSRRKRIKINDFLLLPHSSPTSAIMNLLGWVDTKRGSSFWAKEYLEYLDFFKRAKAYKLTNKTEKYYEFFQKIKKINQ